jgi:hypothetical protein
MVNRVNKIGRYVGALKSASKQLLGKDLSRAVSARAVGMATPAASPASFAKGGKVKKTGMAKVHKGEVVLTAKTAKALKALMK